MRTLKNIVFFVILVFLFSISCERNIPVSDPNQNDTIKSVITNPLSNGEIVNHTYYTLSYNEEHEQAEWVYYTLSSFMLSGPEDRTEDFRPDTLVSTGSAALADYKGSGYDRGHLCPAGDMTISHTAMSESFYLSNMSPQDPSFNRGIWATLESTVRNIARTDTEIIVVTGPVFKNNKGYIGTNQITVPGYFYKIIFSPRNEKMIGFVLPNEKGVKEVKDYAVTVDSIERFTGINFFPKLAPAKENELESKVDVDKWELVH